MSELYRLYDLEDKTYLDANGLATWLELTHYSGETAKLAEHPNIVVEKGFSFERNGETVILFDGDIFQTKSKNSHQIRWSQESLCFEINNPLIHNSEIMWNHLSLNWLELSFNNIIGNIHSQEQKK